MNTQMDLMTRDLLLREVMVSLTKPFGSDDDSRHRWLVGSSISIDVYCKI
jgi:hypothetical protein